MESRWRIHCSSNKGYYVESKIPAEKSGFIIKAGGTGHSAIKERVMAKFDQKNYYLTLSFFRLMGNISITPRFTRWFKFSYNRDALHRAYSPLFDYDSKNR